MIRMLKLKLMCKKLLVFLLAFGVGIVFIQLFRQNEKKLQEPIILTESISENSQNAQPFNPIGIFFSKFKKAVEEDDREMVASSIKFPVKIVFNNSGKKSSTIIIKNEAEFLLNYDQIFDDSVKDIIYQTKTGTFLVTLSGVITNKSGIVMKMTKISGKTKPVKNEDFEIKIHRIGKKIVNDEIL